MLRRSDRWVCRRDESSLIIASETSVGVEIMIKVTVACYVNDYVIWVSFSDGTEGEVDLRDELYGDVFEPLKNPDAFKTFFVNPEWGTIAWPNGPDFAPEFLYSAAAVHA